MKSLKTLCLILSCLCLGAPLRAEGVQATVMSASGEAQVTDLGGQELPIKAGSLLYQGSRIRTQAGATVQLMLADGSKLHIGPNTDLTLTEMTKSGESFGNVFNLVKGLIKATVQKLTLGSKFELTTTHGVAAVKGTEYEAEADENGLDVRVKEGRVWLHDLKKELKEEIGEGHKGRSERGKLGKAVKMKREEWERFARWAEANVPRRGDALDGNRLWDRLRPDQKLKALRALRDYLGDAYDEIVGLREEERRARWKERVRNVDERKLAAEDARVDFAMGRSLFDRKLRRVRIDEFVLRPSANQVQVLNYTRREGRTDLVNIMHTFNKDLPYYLGEAKGLFNNVWWQAQAPEYWKTDVSVVFANSFDDSLSHVSKFYDPVQLFLRWELPVQTVQIYAQLTDLRAPTSGTILESWVRATVNGTGPNTTSTTGPIGGAGSPTGNNVLSGGAAVATTSNLKWDGTLNGTTSGVLAPIITFIDHAGLETHAGDLAYGIRHKLNGGAGATLEFKNYIIDENGRVKNFADYQGASLFDALLDLRFRSFNEIVIGSSLFSNDIDIVSKLLPPPGLDGNNRL